MPSPRPINQAGLEIIKRHESWRDRQYLCPAGKPTIGWGHVIQPGERFQEPISQAQGLALLAKDVESAAAAVERLVKVPLNDNQFSALVSLTYNIGADEDADDVAEGLGDSTLLRLLNAGDTLGAANEFPKWRKSRGKVLAGLVERRAEERELFLTPCEQPKAEAASREDAAPAPFTKETKMELAMRIALPLIMKMLPNLISLVTPALRGLIWNGVTAFKEKAYETPNPADNILADALEGVVVGLGLNPPDSQPAS
ncbi:MAG: lysozyme [Desulfarculus sp.]|nr:lysozyme [Desulfarculus sp.]